MDRHSRLPPKVWPQLNIQKGRTQTPPAYLLLCIKGLELRVKRGKARYLTHVENGCLEQAWSIEAHTGVQQGLIGASPLKTRMIMQCAHSYKYNITERHATIKATTARSRTNKGQHMPSACSARTLQQKPGQHGNSVLALAAWVSRGCSRDSSASKLRTFGFLKAGMCFARSSSRVRCPSCMDSSSLEDLSKTAASYFVDWP